MPRVSPVVLRIQIATSTERAGNRYRTCGLSLTRGTLCQLSYAGVLTASPLRESNPRPPAYHADALPSELRGRAFTFSSARSGTGAHAFSLQGWRAGKPWPVSLRGRWKNRTPRAPHPTRAFKARCAPLAGTLHVQLRKAEALIPCGYPLISLPTRAGTGPVHFPRSERDSNPWDGITRPLP